MRQSLNGEKKRNLKNEKLEKVYAGVHLTSFIIYGKTLINISEGFCEAQKRLRYYFIDLLYVGWDRNLSTPIFLPFVIPPKSN